MALQRQTVSVPLGVGMDTKTDSKQVQLGKLLALENAVFQKVGEIRKRTGLKSLGIGIAGGSTTISSARGLASYKDELNLIDSSGFYSHFEAQDTWVKKSNFSGVSVETRGITKPGTSVGYQDCLVAYGLIAYIWLPDYTGSSLTVSIFDQASGQPILSEFLISSTSTLPKIVAAYGNLYFLYDDTGNLVSRKFDPNNPTTLGSPVTLAAGSNFVDAMPLGNTYAVATSIPGGSMRLGLLDQTGAFTTTPAPVTWASSATTIAGVNMHVQYTGDPATDAIYVVWRQQTAPKGLYYAVYSPNLVQITAPTLIQDGTDNRVSRNFTVCFETTTSARIYYRRYNASLSTSTGNVTWTATLSRSGSVSSPAVFIRSLAPASKPFTYQGKSYMIMVYPETLQSTYFIVRSSGEVVSRFLAGNAGGYMEWNCPGVYSITSTKFISAIMVKSRLKSESGKIYSVNGLQSVTMDFDESKIFQAATVGPSLFITGGMLSTYDGAKPVEVGFNWFPVIEGANIATPGTGNITAGTRSYVFVFEWTDALGQIHRSAPSIPIQIVYTDASATGTAQIQSLMATNKANVRIVGYRTVAGGTTYYRYTPLTSPPTNDPSTDSLVITDNISDTALISNELLYTTGGILENIAPPSARVAFPYNNRLVLLGLEDKNSFWYSKTYTQGEAIAFNDGLVGRVDAEEGGLTAGGVIDDKLILFKSGATFVTAGQGPLDTGLQNDLLAPQLITSDVGCNQPKSVVRTPVGLMFKSAKGFYLLDRSLTAQYLGAPVEDYNSLTVSSAIVVPGTNQVRFTHTDGSAVVYDYHVGQWGAFTNYKAVAATTYKGKYAIIRSTGRVDVENSGSFLDNGSRVSFRVVTPWIPLSGLQGFQRVYEASILGRLLSQHTLRVQIGYDFADEWVESKTISTRAALGSDYYGEGSYYGSEGTYSSADGVEQFKIKPGRQKCQAIRFEITDLTENYSDGEGLALSELALSIGVKPNLNRVRSGKVMA